jgi:hypothetical protein
MSDAATATSSAEETASPTGNEPRDQVTVTQRAITARSVLVGTAAVILVCALSPLNDLILSDTSLTAGFVPLAAVLISFLLVVGINGPLHCWAPRYALGTGELAVVLLMTLVACSIPNWGLMRFFVPTPVAPFHLGASDERFWQTFVDMGLPRWLFPIENLSDGRTDAVANWFFSRVPRGESIPWRPWIVPLLSWGIFAAAMLATLVAMGRLVLEQWATNERLSFPLVQVQAALIEPPSRGKAFNAMFRSPLLWIALGGVFAIHMLSCLNAYFPRYFPNVPLRYDLTAIFSEEPFYYLRSDLKKAMVSLTVVGVTYFIRSRAAFSLWATFIVMNCVDVYTGMRRGEVSSLARADEHLGACLAFILAIAWIGRHHWLAILKGALGRDAVRGYRGTLLTLIIGIAVMLAWLCAVGVKPWMAILIVVFALAAHLVVARVVAETGLPFYRAGISVSQVYTNLPTSWLSARDVYFAQVFTVLGPLTTRDSVTTLAQHGLAVSEQAGLGAVPRQRGGLGMVIGWALFVGCLVAAPATLYCHYTYPTPASAEARPARNYFGAEYVPQRDVRNPVNDFARGRFPSKPYDPAAHVAGGFAITALLEFLSLRLASWPFLPVGFVASHGAFIGNAWFSIFLGWLAQLIVVRLGGARLFEQARPFFIGMIFGECLAAGAWLVINAILVMNGYESRAVNFLL